MSEEDETVGSRAHRRVSPDTARRLRWLLVASLLVHLLLTPMAGWLGLVGLLFTDEPAAPPPEEQLETIPVELFDAPREPAPQADTPSLPEDDPVGFIEQMVPEPPAVPALPPPEPVRSAVAPPQQTAPPAVSSAAPSVDPESAPTDAGAPQPSADAGRGREPAAAEKSRPHRSIEEPVALAGKAGALVEKQAYVSLILYADRIRGHAVGERIARLLPTLPQWQDFFGEGGLNPVSDFDRLMIIGPSFYNSANVVAALEYNTEPSKVRRAINGLVKRDGEWLKGTEFPAARAHADRADRIFMMPRPGFVLVVPPNLQQSANQIKGLPPPQGPEAMVAYLAKPHRPLARFNVQIPESVEDARVRLTPLSQGRVRLELQAQDASPEQAQATARQVSQAINALADLSSSLSGLLDLVGFGRTVALPRFKLQAKGREIWGEQVLSWEQVDFLLRQLEQQAAMWNQVPARGTSSPQPTKRKKPPALRPRPQRKAPPAPSR